MKICCVEFNIVLLLILASGGLGCQSLKEKNVTTLRLHLEVNNPDRLGVGQSVSIGKTEIFSLLTEKEPFLDEGHVKKASVVKALGGFSILLQLDRHGSWVLEQYSTAERGKRVAIFGEFGEARWLAAPVLNHTIKDGAFTFTPDMTLDEAYRFVEGLNNVAEKVQKHNP